MIWIKRTYLKIAIRGLKFKLKWYGMCYVFMFFLLRKLFVREIIRRKIDITEGEINDLSFSMFSSGIIFARIASVLMNKIQYGYPIDWKTLVCSGGIAFQGGIVGGLLGGWIFLSSIGKQSLYLQILDVGVYLMPIGIWIGRIANYLNLEFMNPLFMMPMCIWFALTEGLLLLALMKYARVQDKVGKSVMVFVGLYCILRFINDGFRGEPTVIYDFKFSELFCTIGMAISFICLKLINYKNYDDLNKND